MGNDKKIPALRFPGFEGDLEKVYLIDLADVSTGNKDTQNRVKDGRFPFFVRSQTVETIDTYSYDGEAILTSGDGVGVGKNFHYINGKFDYHQRVYCIFNFKKKVLGKFVYQYFAEKFQKRVMRLSAKNSVDSVRREMITLMTVNLPPLREQQKIASFLSSVDDKIQHLQKKKDLLEQYKKGVMQRIFNQEIRFKDDDGKEFSEWKEVRLGSLGEFSGGGTPDRANLEFWKGEIPWISSSDVSEGNIHNIKHERFISREAVISSAAKLIPRNSLLFVSRVGIGKVAVSDRTLTTSQDFTNLILREDNPHYLAFYFLANKEVLFGLAQGTSIKGFTTVDLKLVKVPIPPLPEQHKIATFLANIDDKLHLVTKQLELTKQFKKGLLQQMFV